MNVWLIRLSIDWLYEVWAERFVLNNAIKINNEKPAVRRFFKEIFNIHLASKPKV